MTIAEIINNRINNPDCAFFVGSFVGRLSSICEMLKEEVKKKRINREDEY